MTVNHPVYVTNNKKVISKLPNYKTIWAKHLVILAQPMSKVYLEKSKIYVNNEKSKIWDNYFYHINILPRNRTDIERMALNNPDRQGFIDAIANEINELNLWGRGIPMK